MKTSTHLFLKNHVLSEQVEDNLLLIQAVLARMPLHYWPEKSSKTKDPTQKNLGKLKQLCVLQSMHNEWIRQELRDLAFREEVGVRPHSTNGQRLDFATILDSGRHLVGETEFGNHARLDCDLLKISDAYRWGLSECGVLICPTAALSRITTGGGITYESAVARVRELHPDSLAGPLVIIGIQKQATVLVDWSTSCLPDADALSANTDDKTVICHAISELRAGVAVFDIGMPGHEARKREAIRSSRPLAQLQQEALF